MSKIDIKVPDLGDAKDVEVIEILVQPGDRVEVEEGLISVESDKATMEIPSPDVGIIAELKVGVGDRISEGTLIAVLEKDKKTEVEAAPISALESQAADDNEACDIVVLGGGPGGYSAAFRAADLGLNVILVERYPTLGGVCLNVGCIPSKALLHVASVMEEAKRFEVLGVAFKEPKIDIDKLRGHKQGVVDKLTGGLDAMAKMRKVKVMQGVGRFVDEQHLQIDGDEGSQIVAFKRAIIATGSRSINLPFMPEDERIMDSTGALELPGIPDRMLIIGDGIIGLEMASVYAALGSEVDIVEMLEDVIPSADPDLVKVWRKVNKKRLRRVMTQTRVNAAESKKDGIQVEMTQAGSSSAETRTYDLVLQAIGRAPNTELNLEAVGVALNDQGFVGVDKQMRTNVKSVFAIGDVVGQPMLAHKAVHEGHVAAEVAAGELLGDEKLKRQSFDARVIPSVAYTDPEIAWVGLTESQSKENGQEVNVSVFPWSASGRALANEQGEGFTKLIFDRETGRILGGSIIGANAGDLIGEVVLAIEMAADAVDVGNTIHPHPTFIETVGLAAEAAEGKCTDLPPPRHKK